MTCTRYLMVILLLLLQPFIVHKCLTACAAVTRAHRPSYVPHPHSRKPALAHVTPSIHVAPPLPRRSPSTTLPPLVSLTRAARTHAPTVLQRQRRHTYPLSAVSLYSSGSVITDEHPPPLYSTAHWTSHLDNCTLPLASSVRPARSRRAASRHRSSGRFA